MEFVPLAALAALVAKFVDFARFATSRDWRAAVTQALAWAAGAAAALLFRATSWAAGVDVAGRPLADMSAADAVVYGLLAASAAGVAVDARRALDNTDTAVKPPLLGGLIPARSPRDDSGHGDVATVLLCLLVAVVVLAAFGVLPLR